jgi:hypothetical protein
LAGRFFAAAFFLAGRFFAAAFRLAGRFFAAAFFFAGRFLAVDFRAVDLRAVVFFAAAFLLAGRFLAVDFRLAAFLAAGADFLIADIVPPFIERCLLDHHPQTRARTSHQMNAASGLWTSTRAHVHMTVCTTLVNQLALVQFTSMMRSSMK